MTQTPALLVDAYRELNSRKLFWITMMLSGAVVAAFAMVGLSPTGIKVLFWDIPVPIFNEGVISRATFYKLLFTNLGIGIWLAWGATILALVSTAGIMPDFISGGAIELTLSKPISRLRLFTTKYVTGLLFVTLQVGVFSVASFVVIGLRGGVWIPGVLLGVPIVVLFFSYLFGICVLVGLVTRSTIASLLLTILAWLFLFGLNATDAIFIQLRESATLRVEFLANRVQRQEQIARGRLAERHDAGADAANAGAAGDPGPGPYTIEQLDAENDRLPDLRKRLDEERGSLGTWTRWSRVFVSIKTPLPKTSETVEMLDRLLISDAELAKLRAPGDEEPINIGTKDDVRVSNRDLRRRTQDALRHRSAGWVVGTSLGFEAFVFLVSAWVFCRRDF